MALATLVPKTRGESNKCGLTSSEKKFFDGFLKMYTALAEEAVLGPSMSAGGHREWGGACCSPLSKDFPLGFLLRAVT